MDRVESSVHLKLVQCLRQKVTQSATPGAWRRFTAEEACWIVDALAQAPSEHPACKAAVQLFAAESLDPGSPLPAPQLACLLRSLVHANMMEDSEATSAMLLLRPQLQQLPTRELASAAWSLAAVTAQKRAGGGSGEKGHPTASERQETPQPIEAQTADFAGAAGRELQARLGNKEERGSPAASVRESEVAEVVWALHVHGMQDQAAALVQTVI